MAVQSEARALRAGALDRGLESRSGHWRLSQRVSQTNDKKENPEVNSTVPSFDMT